MRDLGPVGLIAGRELRERSRQKSFKLSTALMALGLLAAVVVPQVLVDGGPTTLDIGVVGPPGEVVAGALEGVGDAADSELRVVEVPDVASGEARLGQGSLDALVTGGDVVVAETPEPGSDLALVTASLAQAGGVQRALAEAGLPPGAVSDALGRPPVPVRILEPVSEAEDEAAQPLLFLGVLVLYVALLTFGSAVATGVVEEKSSRVVEVLLAAVRPHQLLAGKVLGIGVLGVVQLVLVATPALVVAVATGTELPAGSPLTVASLVLWFVLGYAFYSCAYAAAGSLVSRMEEAQNTSFPITGTIIATYFAALSASNDPGSGLARIFSLLPPTAPLVMPTRAALGNAPPWEVPLAVALSLAATYGLVRLAGRIYAGAILSFGAKVKLRQALRSAAGGEAPASATSAS